MKITGDKLVEWGFSPGKEFKALMAEAQRMSDLGHTNQDVRERLTELYEDMQPKVPANFDSLPVRTNTIPFATFLDVETEDEVKNLEAVIRHFDALMRTPVVVQGAVMPDAMPSGHDLGTITVGGVVSSKGIHPGFHSADICCSMAVTMFKRNDKTEHVMDTAMATTHFGLGKRAKSEVRRNNALGNLLAKFEKNDFLKDQKTIDAAENHFMTQGDGNHFFYLGEIESTGQMVIVTHHGSRSAGALLYSKGMAAARRHTEIVSPRTPYWNAWLDPDTAQGESYWEALQLIREWTKLNHFAIHDEMASRLGNKIEDRFWNEHNFVFRKPDGLFYHGKGATPSFDGFSADDDGRTLIPMNMASPILMTSHTDRADALGFAPHGAGRNYSRTEHMRRIGREYNVDSRGISPNNVKDIIAKECPGLDVRFYTGQADISEMPSSYKSAEEVERQIVKYGLAKVEDRILPRGSIMAGEGTQPWKNKKKGKSSNVEGKTESHTDIENVL